MPRRHKDTKNSLKNHFVSLGREEMIRDIRSLSDVETSLDVFPSTPLRERDH